MLVNCLAVGIGGFVGSVLRYLVGNAIPHEAFPWATLVINVVGSFALAAIAGLALRGAIDDVNLSLMLRVGLCGGFTTMSTFSLEVVELASRGALVGAMGYVALTCVLCVAAAYAGTVAVRA
jgi:CrcB protein